ncbi:MAG: cyclic nucleotide-binding domain-containing protein, partial [Ignavibacteriaceae bacterium]
MNKLFTDMDDSVITSIYKPENFKEVNEGTIIYRAGDRSNELFLLLRGDVKIKFPSHNYISRKLFNDFFGEKELYDHTRRNSSAVANSKCLLYTLPIHIVETL